MVVNNYKLTH